MPDLFSPLQLGPATLPNRLVMAPSPATAPTAMAYPAR